MTPSYCLLSLRLRSTSTCALTLSSSSSSSQQQEFNSSSSSTHHQLLFKNSPYNKSLFPILRLNNAKHIASATLSSSFADDDQGSDQGKSNETEGMAQAFNISSGTASAISMCIALAALVLPFFMRSMTAGVGAGARTKAMSYLTLLFGLYMAWNIGANDVANAMGTSVGSGALTLRQAVVTAGVLEFSGALLMGTHVTTTMQKGILVAGVFQGKDMLLFAGLLSSLAAAGTWLQVI